MPKVGFIFKFQIRGLRPTAVRLQKNKDEQISVGHFCGKHAMGTKKTEIDRSYLLNAYGLLGKPDQ